MNRDKITKLLKERLVGEARYLTKQQAIEAMRLGNKVTHIYFSSNEYIYMAGRHIIYTEDGYDFTNEFHERLSESWVTGWYIDNTIPAPSENVFNIRLRKV